MSTEKKHKNEIKVYVRMHDTTRMLGNVFLSEDERLQDIMNDGRMFIPVHVEDQNTTSLVMLSKRYIQQIEEVLVDGKRDEEFFRRFDRRNVDRAQKAMRAQGGGVGMNLELEEPPFNPGKGAEKLY